METAGDEKGVMRVRHVPKASDAPARGCPPAILVLQCAGPLSCISLGGHPDAQSRSFFRYHGRHVIDRERKHPPGVAMSDGWPTGSKHSDQLQGPGSSSSFYYP